MFERMTLYVRRKLTTNLRRHERVCDAFSVKIASEFRQVQSYVFGDDANSGTARQSGIHIHHTRVETERSVCRHFVTRLQVVVTVVPMTECYQVPVLQHHPFRYTGRTGCIKENEEVLRLRLVMT